MTALEAWEGILARLRSGADRLTHTFNRRRARARVQRSSKPRRILVICHGNICRSPYAAAYLRRTLAVGHTQDIVVESAGLIGPGRPANEQAAAIASERGLDLSGHRSRLLAHADVAAADLVLVMTHAQRELLTSTFGARADRIELLGDFDTDNPPSRDILDPYGKSDEVFRAVFQQIERSISGLDAAWSHCG